MKTVLFTFLMLVFGLNVLVAQSNLKTTECIFLLDITDNLLFAEIKDDFNNNLPDFFAYTNLGRIKELESFRLSVCPIGSGGVLSLKSQTIAIPRKGMPINEVKKLSSPQPLMAMLREQLAFYETQLQDNNTRSLIIDVVLKAIGQTNENFERTVIVVCSDLLEFSNITNFYNKIPTAQELTAFIEQCIKRIDPITFTSVRKKIENGCIPEIVIVYKPKRSFERSADLKLFWQEFFRQLGLPHVSFIDNFTQDPQI